MCVYYRKGEEKVGFNMKSNYAGRLSNPRRRRSRARFGVCHIFSMIEFSPSTAPTSKNTFFFWEIGGIGAASIADCLVLSIGSKVCIELQLAKETICQRSAEGTRGNNFPFQVRRIEPPKN